MQPALSSSSSTNPAHRAIPRPHLIVLLLAAFTLHLVGLQHTLPLLPDVDEDVFAQAAVRVASSGDLNPGFYGTPGATTIYPLAVGYRLWFAATQHGMLLHPDPLLARHFAAQSWEFYYLGRLLSTAYNVAGLAVLVLVGRRVFTTRAALAAGWLFAFHGLSVVHGKLVRTDSAATFFSLVGLYCCLRLLEQPSLRRQVAAGAAIGLAIASRFFMAALAAAWAVVNGALWRGRRSGWSWATAGAGAAMVPVAFLIANPAMLPNWAEALTGLRAEGVTTHLGADGLSPLGNLAWYLADALPATVTWAQTLASLGGAVLIARSRRPAGLALLAFCATYLAAISLSPRHFARYLIPLLPCVALLAAHCLDCSVAWLGSRARLRAAPAQAVFALSLMLLLAWPGFRTVRLDVRYVNGNSRLAARAWVLENLPPGSRILQETYGAPLQGTPLRTDEVRALVDAAADGPASLHAGGYDYVVASSEIYNRFFAEPERYPGEIAFYTALFADGNLIYEMQPGYFMDGPTIRIYAP